MIRDIEDADVAGVVALSLRAWAPVFASFETVLGRGVYRQLHPDWRSSQAAAVERVCRDPEMRVQVAVEDGRPVAVGSHQPVDIGGSQVSEVVGVAALPWLRGRGLGAGIASALVAHATETADLVFLAAGDDDVARVYERVGFARLATTAVADRTPAC